MEKLSHSHPLHVLLARCHEPSAKLIQLVNISRDENKPTDISVPSSCLVLDSNGWAQVLKKDSFFEGILLRTEYREATNAVFSYYQKVSSRFITPIGNASDESTSEHILQEPFKNPFSDLSIEEKTVRTGFILLGHPGTGE
jgi:hypothetical protein